MIARTGARGISPRYVIAGAVLLTIYAEAVLLLTSGLAARRPAIASGLAIDLVVTAALAVYFIALRPLGRSPWLVMPVVVVGGLVTRGLLPGTPVTAIVGGAGALIELAAVTKTGVRVWRASRTTGRARASGASLLDALEAGVAGLGLPRRAGALLAAELAIVGYGLFGWRRPAAAPGRFTCDVEKGWSLFAGTLIALSVVEAIGLHVAIAPHAPRGVWVLTALSLYGALWLLGDLHALRHGGVRISDEGVRLDLGVRWRAQLPWDVIASVERLDAMPAKGTRDADGVARAIVLEPTVLVRLHAPVVIQGPFGRLVQATAIATTVDDAARFVDEVAARLAARAA